MKRRILSFLCALSVLLSLAVVPAYAADGVSLQDTINVYDSGVIKLEEDASDITVTKDVIIDLNGYSINGVTVTGGTLYVMDSQTADFTVDDGNFGKVTNVTGNAAAAEGYLSVDWGNSLSFHRVDLEIKSMSLRPGNAGVYYTSNFAGDEVVSEQVFSYGIALSVAGEPTAENLDKRCAYSVIEGFEPGTNAANGTLLVDVMSENNTDGDNRRFASMPVYGRAYIKTLDGYVFGPCVSRDFRSLVESVDGIFGALNTTQKAGILELYNTYAAVVESWNVPNIRGCLMGDIVITVPVQSENGVVTETVTVEKDGMSITVPFGTLVEKSELTLKVTKKEQSDSGIEAEDDQTLMPFDVHVDGVSSENTQPITVELGKVMPENLNMGNYTVYHVEENGTNAMELVAVGEEFTAHNQYKYTLDGELTLNMASFSEVPVVYDNTAKWEGGVNHEWYNADTETLYIRNADQLWSLSQIVGGMAEGIAQDSFDGQKIVLLADIDLNDSEDSNNSWIFYPVGYYNSEYNYDKGTSGKGVTSGFQIFKGDFDGNGHTIKNFYQNTWEMKGDHNWYNPEDQHYRDGMGLFGRIEGSTIKNLSVDNFKCDSEIGTSGTIATYADSTAEKSVTFENISITNCNPRVYNIGNGGIVGSAGWYSRENTDAQPIILKNITVDETNTISALWGSWDVGCGGLLGRYYPDAYADAEFGISFDNCHVAATIDVYNDVCGNYQYYWYRYCGMVIGTVEKSTADNGADLTGIKATNCTVDFGDRHEYYYCEFVKNSIASYTHDYQFSRVDHNTLSFTDTNDNRKVDRDEAASVTGCTHDHEAQGYETINGQKVLIENNQAVYIPFRQLFGGNGWGINGIDLEEYPAIQVSEVTKSVTKFEADENAADVYTTGNTVTIGDLFSAKTGATIKNENVQVFVSPADPMDTTNTVSGIYNANTTDWTKGTLTFSGMGKAIITITDYYFCTPTTITVTIEDQQPVVKFDVVMNNGDFLHRVGNSGTVALDKLFKAKDDVTVGTVSVTVEAVNGTGASGTYANNAIQFNGTGVVKVTITDNDYCTPTELYLEVVEAVNATSKTDVTANDVVLLSNISGTFKVSNGRTLYGNGFKATCSGNGAYRSAAVSYGFVTVENGGVLDNLKIICDLFPESYIYTSEMTAISDGTYPYGYSAVVISGNSTISNCYIYGARNNIQIAEGNVTVKNTVLECGSLSNIHIKSGNSSTVMLEDVTTIQYQTVSSYNTDKTVLGFGVLVGTNESASNANIVLKGDLKQYNWVTNDDTSVSSTYAKQAISAALEKTAYQNTIGGKTAVNMGIVYLNECNTSNPFANTDLRENKDSIPYVWNEITISGKTGYVYSIAQNINNGIDRCDPETDGVIPYNPNAQGQIALPVVFEGTENASLGLETAYNTTEGRWVTTFSVDLDNIAGGSYAFKFSDIKVRKYGEDLSYTVKDSAGNTVSKDTVITLNQLETSEYTLQIEDNRIYDKNAALTDTVVERSCAFVLYATKTSIDPPQFILNAEEVGAYYKLATSKSSDWYPAYPALDGVSVKYWSKSTNSQQTVNLKTLYNKGTISGNVWTYTCDDYTVSITGGVVHTNPYYLKPVCVEGNLTNLYFISTDKAFTYETTSRDILLTYVFTDSNASTTWNGNDHRSLSFENMAVYNYNNFKKGTLTQISDWTGQCVAEGTLITLANGTQVPVEELTGEEMLLVWNLETGRYDAAPIVFVESDAETEYEVIRLVFSDGTDVEIIYEHGFFDVTTGEYVYLDAYNAENYIGHCFIKQGDLAQNTWETVELTDVVIETRVTTAYSPVTFSHLCYYVDGMLSMPGGIEGLFNIFEVDTDTMSYNAEKMAADIETYGLFTYEDFAALIPEEAFYAFNGAWLKVAMGKGMLTWEDIEYMANRYVPLM